jgi:DNA-binding transcriptional LysR family regulator
MTLVQLRHFITLAKTGSFVRTAGLLHITQPALSRSIKALEEELGQLLFDRVGKKIELTSFGEITRKRCECLLDDADFIRQSGHPSEPAGAGRLRLGLGSGPGAMLTTPILTHVAQLYPHMRVEIFRANTETLVRMLREREVDALVVDIRSLKPSPDLKVDQVVEVEGGFMCRPGHPLEKLAKVSLNQLLQYPIASTPLSDELARILVERYGERAHPGVMVQLLSDELSHLVDVARQSDTILLAIRPCAPQLAWLKISPALNARARFGMVTMAGRAEALFLSEIRKLMMDQFQ